MRGAVCLLALAGCSGGIVVPAAATTPGDGAPNDPSTVASTPSANADVTVFIDTTRTLGRISPFIYGTNTVQRLTASGGTLTIGRLSGIRWSTYNWETNASNAGVDAGHGNDAELVPVGENTPAAPVTAALDIARAAGTPLVVTLPMLGKVSADTRGYVWYGEPGRFLASLPRGGLPNVIGDPTDGVVYEDAFVETLHRAYPELAGAAPRVIFSLDDEPELWNESHPQAHSEKPTYGEVIGKNIAYAEMIDDVWPEALVFGGVHYGWDGFDSLQGAPDCWDYDYPRTVYLAVYLDALRAAEQCASRWSTCDPARGPRRLVDALDVHWYPETIADGQRIIVADATPGLVQARVQAPRSLWDPTYVEDSWITAKTGHAIAFLPWIQALIADHYPGTNLVISEYDFGGGGDVSGAIATADALGLFGRYGVHAAFLWELADMGSHAFAYAAIRMYQNFDGEGGHFGNVAVDVVSSESADHSVYAAIDGATPGVVTVVAINKKSVPSRVWLGISSETTVRSVRAATLTATSIAPVPGPPSSATDNGYLAELPPMSVTTLIFDP